MHMAFSYAFWDMTLNEYNLREKVTKRLKILVLGMQVLSKVLNKNVQCLKGKQSSISCQFNLHATN